MLTSYERTVRWRNNVKRKLIEACGGGCRLCGYNRCDKSLEFHHITPNAKDFGISARIKAIELIIAEVKKCVLLCANCHREIHAGIGSCDGIEPTFNHRVFERTPIESPCAHCGRPKKRALKFCSTHCAAQQHRKVRWDAVNLYEMLIEHNFNVSRVGHILGVSHAAVKKRMRILHISRPAKTANQ